MKKTVLVNMKDEGAWRRYDFKAQISASSNQSFRCPLRPESEPYLEKMGPVASFIVRETLVEGNGVTSVHVEPYKIEVWKAPLYDWAEIEEQIVTAIRGAFPDQEVDFLWLTSQVEDEPEVAVTDDDFILVHGAVEDPIEDASTDEGKDFIWVYGAAEDSTEDAGEDADIDDDDFIVVS